MILSALRLFRSLSGYHYRTIIITILLPVIGPPMIASFAPDLLALQVSLFVVVFVAWTVCAVLAVAHMLRRDMSEAEQRVDQQAKALSDRVCSLKEEDERLRAGLVDLRQQLKQLEERVRSTFEELDAVLPPRRISLRGAPIVGIGSISKATLRVDGGSKMARLQQWLRRAIRRLWKWVYGTPEDS